LAAELFGIAKETPPEWSVRIGVFAKWGEGKTTMLRFLEQMAVGESYIPVRFAPWSARTWDDLWVEFAAALVESLKTHNATTKSLNKLKYKLLGKKIQKKVEPLRHPLQLWLLVQRRRLELALLYCNSSLTSMVQISRRSTKYWAAGASLYSSMI
jgi:ABC-type Na+ transport system ATPase subunit NatA